jgi:hypothetical protein
MGPGWLAFSPNMGGPVVAQPIANITDKRIANPIVAFKYSLFISRPPLEKNFS